MSEQFINPAIAWDEDGETHHVFNERVIDADTGKELIVMRDEKDCTKDFIRALQSARIFANPTFQFKEYSDE